jgi:hypothetical protein
MPELRLQKESERILAQWWKSSWPKESDHQLVREVLRTIANGTWRGRWCWTEDIADDQPVSPVVTISPRKNLVVLVRFWLADDPPAFQLINIFDQSDLPDDD